MNLIRLDAVASTNGWLADRAAGLPDGQWVRAVSQTAGRGRQGRAWAMLPGNLAASVLVRLHAGDAPPGQIGFVAAVALHEAVSAHVAPARLMLKWPNDLLLDGAKLSGILCERAGDEVIVGFGVNLAAAPKLESRATIALPPPAPDPEAFLARLADRFAHWLARWRTQGFEPVRAAWLAAAHPLGTPLHLPGAPPRPGTFQGLAADGALMVQTAGGPETIHAGEIMLADADGEPA